MQKSFCPDFQGHPVTLTFPKYMLWKVLPQTTFGPSLVTLVLLVSEILSMFKFRDGLSDGRSDGRTDAGGSFYRLTPFHTWAQKILAEMLTWSTGPDLWLKWHSLELESLSRSHPETGCTKYRCPGKQKNTHKKKGKTKYESRRDKSRRKSRLVHCKNLVHKNDVIIQWRVLPVKDARLEPEVVARGHIYRVSQNKVTIFKVLSNN